MADKQLLEVGNTFKANGKIFEVIHVSAQGDEGEQHHFVYEVQLQSEAEEKRQLEAKLAEEAQIAANKLA